MGAKEPIGAEKDRDSARRDAAAELEAGAKAEADRPLLMVDIDGVISLFGAAAQLERHSLDGPCSLDGSFHSIEGIPHFLSASAAAHLLSLSSLFALVWASGWEERADEHLPHLLGLPKGLPFLRFERSVGRANAHWKLAAIDVHAAGRPLAWIDDAFNPDCHAWAQRRAAATLLVQTDPRVGLTEPQAQQLARWALGLRRDSEGREGAERRGGRTPGGAQQRPGAAT